MRNPKNQEVLDWRDFTGYKGNDPSARRLNFIIQACVELSHRKRIKDTEVIDIGCGASPITRPIAALGFKVLGIDIDPKRIRYCKKVNPLPNLTFEERNVYELDSKKRYDIIICSEVLEHQRTPLRFLRKLEELVTSDGVIIITIPNGYGAYENFLRFYHLVKKTNFHPMHWLKGILPSKYLFDEKESDVEPEHSQSIPCPHLQFFTLKRFEGILSTANLSIVKKQNDHILLNTFPGNIFYRMNKNLIFLDGKLADFLPAVLANGWFFVCKKKSRRKYQPRYFKL